MEQTIVVLLNEHLPYELDMLEECFVRLFDKGHARLRDDKTVRNALIESFWLHARNICEYLLQHPTSSHERGIAAAQDVAPGYDRRSMKDFRDPINDQISHLRYERASAVKLDGYEMLRVKQAIDREVLKFQDKLEDKYKSVWSTRTPTAWVWNGEVPQPTNALSFTTLLPNETTTTKLDPPEVRKVI
jgi:hypothetical protein